MREQALLLLSLVLCSVWQVAVWLVAVCVCVHFRFRFVSCTYNMQQAT